MATKSVHTFKITYPNKIPSVNTIYLIGRNRQRSWLYLNPVVAEYKKEIKIALNKQGVKEQFENYDKGKTTMRVNLSFVIKDEFWSRDVDNLLKATIDAFTDASGLDDSLNLEVHATKILNDIDEKEHIAIVVTTEHESLAQYKWSQMING